MILSTFASQNESKQSMKLNDIAEFVTDKISSSSISLDRYVTTDSLLQNKRGREMAQNLPPIQCALTNYKQGDVLVANIRPYLKKVWFADSEGGCSSDVLVFRAKNGHCPSFLYTVLMQDAFFDYAMSGAKGSKMPRGDRDQVMRYELPTFTSAEEENIGNMMVDIMSKINGNRQINDNLEAMAKQLYDYWFVQFDFPNEEGKPYKSSGGAMVYNERLKRNIPAKWDCYELNKWLEVKSGFAFKSETYISKGKFKVITIKNVQDHHLDTSSCDYVNEIPQGMKEWCSLAVNDRLISLTGNCGRLCIVTEKDLLLNQRVGLLSCNDEYIDYAYLLLSSEEFQTLSNNLAKGAAQANLSPIDLCKNIAVLPPLNVLENFNKQIKPIVANYIQNEIQIAELTKQRDELLPLLMNGQATVNYHLSAC